MKKKSPAKKQSAKRVPAKKLSAEQTAAVEAMLREFENILADVGEKDDIEALMASLDRPSAYDRLGDKEADAKDEAQQIAFDAMEAESEAQARKLAKHALALDPDCVDALVVMTELDAHTPKEEIEGLQRAVAAGERSLGASFIRENTGNFWLLIETRPYMRALAQLAEALRAQGIGLDAIRIYERMLELNPNDNQGVREPLLGLYLETGELSGATRLLEKYKEDGSPVFEWARVLERFLAGDRAAATTALKRARKANPYVELYFTAQKPLPKEMPEMYSPGSTEEAVLCLNFISGAWAEHREACSWLFDCLVEQRTAAAPSKARRKKPPTAREKVQ